MAGQPSTASVRLISGKALFAVLAWGASFVATRIALQSFSPFGLVAIRLIIGTAMLVAIIRIRRGPLLPIKRDAFRAVFLGLVTGGHLLIQAYGLQYTTAINTAWIIGFIPVTIAIGSQLLGQQLLSGRGWSGVTTGAMGVLLVTMQSPPSFADARFGDVLQLSSCVTWTVYTLAAVGPVTRNGALRITAVTMGIAAVVLAVGACHNGFVSSGITAGPVLAVAFLGIACSGLAYYCWVKAVDEHGPARVGVVLYIEPFVTLIVAAATLHEPVGANTLAGGVCVLVGVWLVSRGTHSRKTIRESRHAAGGDVPAD